MTIKHLLLLEEQKFLFTYRVGSLVLNLRRRRTFSPGRPRRSMRSTMLFHGFMQLRLRNIFIITSCQLSKQRHLFPIGPLLSAWQALWPAPTGTPCVPWDLMIWRRS